MRAVPAGVALAWVLVASTSAAQPAEPDHVRLDFTAGASCPDARTFRNFVASSLGGRDPFVDDAPEHVRVHPRCVPLTDLLRHLRLPLLER